MGTRGARFPSRLTDLQGQESQKSDPYQEKKKTTVWEYKNKFMHVYCDVLIRETNYNCSQCVDDDGKYL